MAYQGGQPIVLSDVANISYGSGPTRVDRLNRLREVAVTGYLMPGTQIGNIKTAVDPKLQAAQQRAALGQSTYVWGGQAQNLSEETPFILSAVALGILLSYMLMASLFDNVLYPLSIMLTMPQALVGALLALYLTQQPPSIISGHRHRYA